MNLSKHVLVTGILFPLILSGCLRSHDVTLSPPTASGDVIGKQVLVRGMPEKGNIRDDRHGRELWFAYGSVTGTSGTNANGVGNAHFLEDGTYVASIQLNIAPPKDGEFYEGWLMKGISPDNWISIGHLRQGGRESSQTLRFESSQDLRKQLNIAVTRELDDGNSSPGEVVAEGSLKVTKR